MPADESAENRFGAKPGSEQHAEIGAEIDAAGRAERSSEGGALPGVEAHIEGIVGSFESDDASAPAQVAFAYVSDQPITVEWCVDNVSSDDSGAVVTFSGVVRNHDHGRGVLRLSYSGHPTADEVMRQVADDVAAAHPGTRIAVAHRVGELAVGDIALAAAVASAHRAQAFAACAELVDTVKARVPIWKEQWFDDGTTEWVGAG